MKPEELMLGDIVLASGKPIHVTLATLSCKVDVKPMPLTEEVLVKNGWELCKTADTRSYWHDDIPFHIPIEPYHHWRGDEDKIFADDFFDCVYIRIQYIHELQHALKLCGIKKEIIL